MFEKKQKLYVVPVMHTVAKPCSGISYRFLSLVYFKLYVLLQWVIAVLRPSTFLEFLGHISPQPCLILPRIPKTMLDLLSAGLASFVCNIGKGERGWFSLYSASD